jgi:hypothetical protein
MIWIILAVAAPLWLVAKLWRQSGVGTAAISGAYACKAHRTVFCYEATWQHTSRAVQWNATIFRDQRLLPTSGELLGPSRIDPVGLVPDAIESHIDERICAHTCGK